MKTKITIIIMAVLAAAVVTMSVLYAGSRSHIKTLKLQTAEQSEVIDSLLARRMKFIDVQLHVTDKSKNIVYGRHNTGTIQMPQERKYILKIDSTSVVLK